MPHIRNIYEEPHINLKVREADRQENTDQKEMFQNTNTTKVYITLCFPPPFPLNFLLPPFQSHVVHLKTHMIMVLPYIPTGCPTTSLRKWQLNEGVE